MKRLLLSIVFTCVASGLFAKDSTNAKFYFSISGALWNNLAINNVIKDNGGTPFHLFAPEFGIGCDVQKNRFQGNVGIKFIFSKKNEENIPFKFQYSSFQLGLRYKLINIWNSAIYGGLNFEYIPMNFTLYPQKNTIDLDNINPSTQTGTITMKNHSFLLGPSILFENVVARPDLKISFAVSYVFNVGNSKWQAENAVLMNAPIENGNKLTLTCLIAPFQN